MENFVKADFEWYFTLGEGMLKGNEQRILNFCVWVLGLSVEERERHYRCFGNLYYSAKCEFHRAQLHNLECPCTYCRKFAADAIEALDYILNSRVFEIKEDIPQKPIGFVYLMRHGRADTIKIGYSKNPKEREDTLQAEDPDLNLLASWPGTKDDERALHARFSALRTRGEWFRLNDIEIDQLIEEFDGVSA